MKQDLIFTQTKEQTPLTFEDLRLLVPAAFTATKSEDRAERYSHITTSTAIEILGDYQFFPTSARQVKARTRTANKYAQHMIAFSCLNGLLDTDEGRPQIILYNSGDGRSAVRMFSGFYRFICSNGLIAGNGFEVKAGHFQTTASRFDTMVRQAAKTLPEILENIDQLKATELSYPEQRQLANEAMQIRWPRLDTTQMDWSKPGAYSTPATAEHLLFCHRSADVEFNAWTTYNRIQEKLIRGGAEIFSITEKKPDGIWRKSKAVGSVQASLDINRKLWDLVKDHSQRKQAVTA